MVRDSRAVAYSWSKIVDRPEAGGGSQMATYTPASAAMRWNLDDMLVAGAGLWIASDNDNGSTQCGGVGAHAGICFLPYT
jgi:hypothetical protein